MSTPLWDHRDRHGGAVLSCVTHRADAISCAAEARYGTPASGGKQQDIVKGHRSPDTLSKNLFAFCSVMAIICFVRRPGGVAVAVLGIRGGVVARDRSIQRLTRLWAAGGGGLWCIASRISMCC